MSSTVPNSGSNPPVKCLLIANIFAPIAGGSAVVYESLCRFAPPGSMHVLASKRHYGTGEEIPGWRDFDAQAPYPIQRVDLLRPVSVEARSIAHSAYLWLTGDLPIKVLSLSAAARIVRREDIDVVCIGELSSGSWLGLALRRLFGCRVINYIHGEEITTVMPYRFFGQKRREYLHAADAIVAVSGFTRQALVDLMGVDAEKIELIHNGVDAERFQPGPKNLALIQRYGLQGKHVLLTVGRLVPRKGFDMTLRALPRIVADCPDCHYLILGEGEYRARLEEIVREEGVGRHVTFTGRVAEAELADHYRLCDLFLMPNRELSDHDTEGFGLVFLEANACGKAVIGGRAGGVVEAVRDGETGLLVDGSNPAEITEAALRLLRDHTFRETLEHNGLAYARSSSSREKAMQFHRLCSRLVVATPITASARPQFDDRRAGITSLNAKPLAAVGKSPQGETHRARRTPRIVGPIRAGLTLVSPGQRAALTILIYHRVLPQPDPLLVGITDVKLFELQIMTLMRDFSVIPLSEGVQRLRDGTLPQRAASITFDDGYSDNEFCALPILQKFGACATFFIASGYLDGGIMWNDLILQAVRATEGPILSARSLGLEDMPVGSIPEKQDAMLRLVKALKYRPFSEREAQSWRLLEDAGARPPEQLMMTSDQVLALHKAGMEIGAHTVLHPILTKLSLDEARREMVNGRAQLEAITGARVGLFAYPNGRPEMDFSADHVALVSALGFDAAVTTGWGAAQTGDDLFQLPRFTPWGTAATNFKLRLGLNILRSRLGLPSPPYWEMTN